MCIQSIKFWGSALIDTYILVCYIALTYLGILWRLVFPKKPKSLVDEVILVTGSANGIGRQLCLKLARAGAHLVCWDIDKRANNALVVELKKMGAEASGYEVDVSDCAQVQKVANQVKEDIGNVSVVINNAGLMPVHPFLSHNPREVSRAFGVNVFGPMWLLREFIPPMIETKGFKGHVVTICSFGGLVGSRNLSVYCGTKHAINGVIESLRDEIRVHPNKPSIKFTTIYPSCCNTSFAQNVVHTRFPWLLPAMTEPSYVAEKTIEAIQLEKDYVYIPPVLNVVARVIKAFPSNIYWAINDYLNYYVEPTEKTKIIKTKAVEDNGH